MLATLGAATGTIPPYLLRRAVDDLNTRGVDLNEPAPIWVDDRRDSGY